MKLRHTSFIDNALLKFDRALKTLHAHQTTAFRESPSAGVGEAILSPAEKEHAAALMRVNHTGEVMAQALYQGQSMTARLTQVREQMDQAAQEEEDHLAWCEERIRELGSATSLSNPVWYGLSLAMGAVAGLVGDKVSLGFVAAIEDQVCEHLKSHLDKLPEADGKSRAIVEQMLEDEFQHSEHARRAGAVEFPVPVKQGMTLLSRLMTETSYRI